MNIHISLPPAPDARREAIAEAASNMRHLLSALNDLGVNEIELQIQARKYSYPQPVAAHNPPPGGLE